MNLALKKISAIALSSLIIASILFSGAFAATRPIANNNIAEGQYGAIKLTKTATSTSLRDVWKIELGVSGKNKVDTSDVVILLDASGSMSFAAFAFRVPGAKDAMSTLINELWDGTKDSDLYRFSIVAFGWNPTAGASASYTDPTGGGGLYPASAGAVSAVDILQMTPYSDAAGNVYKPRFLGAINGLTLNHFKGSTPTATGLLRAESHFAGSVADNKIIVMITDGGPAATDTTQAGFPSNVFGASNTTNATLQSMKIMQDLKTNKNIMIYAAGLAFPGTVLVPDATFTTGASSFSDLLGFGPGANAKDLIAQQIGLNVAPNPMDFKEQEFMHFGASTPKSPPNPVGSSKIGRTYQHFTSSAGMKEYFRGIADQIRVLTADKATTYDQISEQFELYQWPGTPLFQTEYSYWTKNSKTFVAPNPSYKQINNTDVEWFIKSFADESDPDTLTYYVKLKPSYDIPNKTYPTNNYAYIDYENYNGQPAIKYFPNPFITTPAAKPKPSPGVEFDGKENLAQIEAPYSPSKPSQGFAPPDITAKKQEILTKEKMAAAQAGKTVAQIEAEKKAAKQAAEAEKQAIKRTEITRGDEELIEIERAEKAALIAQNAAEVAQKKADEAKKILSDAKRNKRSTKDQIKKLEEASKKATQNAKIAKTAAEKAKQIAQTKRANKTKNSTLPTPTPVQTPITLLPEISLID